MALLPSSIRGFVHPCQFFIAWDIAYTSWMIFSYLIMRHCDKPSSRGIRFKCETRSFELPSPYSSSPTKKQDNMKPHISKQGKRVSDCDGLRSFKFRQIFIFNRWLVLYIFFSLAPQADYLGVQHLISSFETRVWAQRRRIEVPFEGMPETKKSGFTVRFTRFVSCFGIKSL